MSDNFAPANGSSLLYRQVNSSFVKDGEISSVAFRPTPKDDKKLSVDCATLQTAEGSYKHFTENLKFDSVGTLGVLRDEVSSTELEVYSDALTDNAAHHLIDFSAHGNSAVRKKAKSLRDYAVQRGYLFKEAIS